MIDFIGIGASKSATSWIFKALQEHPGACVPEGKETHFFEKFEPTEQNLKKYRAWFSHCSKNNKIGEYTVTYLTEEGIAARIHSIFPNIQLILSLRDPLQRTLSHLRHVKSRDRLDGDNSLKRALNKEPDALKHSLYAGYIGEYLKHFSLDQFYIIFFEDIKDNPQEVVKNLYGFLEVDDSFEPDILDKKYNTSAARSSKLFWWMNKAYLKLQDIPGGSQLINLIRKSGLNTARVEQMLEASRSKDDQFSNEEKDWLYEEYFKEDINKLEAMLDTDLSSWKRKA